MTIPIAIQIRAVGLALTGVVSRTYTKGSALYEGAAAHADALRAALESLEQYERALAVVDAADEWRDAHAYEPPPEDARQGWVAEKLRQRKASSKKLRAALAAFDTARREGEDAPG